MGKDPRRLSAIKWTLCHGLSSRGVVRRDHGLRSHRVRGPAGLALDPGEFGNEALRIAEVVLLGVGRLAEDRRRIALTEKRRRIVEERRRTPAVGAKLLAGEVALQRRLKYLFDVGDVLWLRLEGVALVVR